METLACDRLAVGFGLVPNAELGRLLGCATAQDVDGKTVLAVDARQATSLPGVFAAGECTGAGGVELSMAEGRIAGLAATGQTVAQPALAERARWAAFARRLAQHFSLSPALKKLAQADTIFCRCEDVAYADCRRLQRLDRGQTGHPLRHGRLPGPGLRRSGAAFVGLANALPAPAALARARGHAQPHGREPITYYSRNH